VDYPRGWLCRDWFGNVDGFEMWSLATVEEVYAGMVTTRICCDAVGVDILKSKGSWFGEVPICGGIDTVNGNTFS